jgi:hypothetical protein
VPGLVCEHRGKLRWVIPHFLPSPITLTPVPAFVNLYYEFWNPLYDFTFSEKSNLVCAAYKAVEPASKKTGYGGQTLYKKVGV